MEDTLINFGSSIKSLENDHIGGYLVLFSDGNSPDLVGDYFTKDTDFGIEDGAKSIVWLHHRKPLKTADGGTVEVKEKIGQATLSIDEKGVLIDAILFNRKQYEEALEAMGWSSGTAAHTVEREKKGKANFVKQWFLGLDASITPTPCEPRLSVVSLKSISDEYLSNFVIQDKAIKAVEKVPAAIKLTSGADIFTQNLTEQNQTFWRIENALCESARDIAKAAAAKDITGTDVDVSLLVSGAVDQFAVTIKSLITTQIKEWLESDMEHEFYVKSTLLDAVIADVSHVKARFEDRLDMVLAAVEKVTEDAKQIHEQRQAQKAGRKISKARMERLKEIMTQLEVLMMEVEPVVENSNMPKSIPTADAITLVTQFESLKMRRTLAR